MSKRPLPSSPIAGPTQCALEPSESVSGPSSLKRVKSTPDGDSHVSSLEQTTSQQLAPVVKPEPIDIPLPGAGLTQIPAHFLASTTKDELGQLLVEAASVSIEFNITLSDRIRQAVDFSDMAQRAAASTSSHEILSLASDVQARVGKESRLETKLSGLRDLRTILTVQSQRDALERAARDPADAPPERIGQTQGRLTPPSLDGFFASLLACLSEDERRRSIEPDLVLALDELIVSKAMRKTYGPSGRDVGDRAEGVAQRDVEERGHPRRPRLKLVRRKVPDFLVTGRWG